MFWRLEKRAGAAEEGEMWGRGDSYLCGGTHSARMERVSWATFLTLNADLQKNTKVSQSSAAAKGPASAVGARIGIVP